MPKGLRAHPYITGEVTIQLDKNNMTYVENIIHHFDGIFGVHDDTKGLFSFGPTKQQKREMDAMKAMGGMFSAAIGVSDASVSPMYQDFDTKLATYFSKKPALLWIGCGDTDFLIQSNRDFVKKLQDGGYPHTYYENDGGHIWRNWRIYFTEFVPLIFK